MLENCFADIYRFFTAFRRVVEDFVRKMTKHRKRKIKNQKIMEKREIWKLVIQTLITILTAIGTSIGVVSCM